MSAAAVARSRLTTAPANVANVGSRVWANVARQDPTYPFQVYDIVSTNREHAMGPNDPGHVHARVRVSSYATGRLACQTVAKGAQTAMSRFWGTATGVVVHDVFLDNEFDAFEETLDDGRRRVWRISQDYMVHYEE